MQVLTFLHLQVLSQSLQSGFVNDGTCMCLCYSIIKKPGLVNFVMNFLGHSKSGGAYVNESSIS